MTFFRRHLIVAVAAIAATVGPRSPLSTVFAFQRTQYPSRHKTKTWHDTQSGSFSPLKSSFLSRRTESVLAIRSSRQRLQTSSTTLNLATNPLVSVASSPVGAIVVLAGIVLVHESGHYLAARLFNITVDEFSIGFGPKLFGFEALGNAFNLRALPLGGYVKFPENYNITLVEQQQQAAQKAFQQRKQQEEWTLWQETLNLVTLGEWDERRRKQRKRQQQQEEEAAISAAKSKWWQSLLGRNGIQSTSSTAATSKDPEDFEIDYYDDPNLLQNRPWTERAVVLSMGVIFNLILSFTIYFGAIGPIGNGLPRPVFDSGVVVSAAPMKDGPAAGLLRKGDIITGVNGKPLEISSATSVAAAQKQVSDVISVIRSIPDGENVEFQIRRGSSMSGQQGNVETSTMPSTTVVSIQPKRNGGNGANGDVASKAPQSIGVFLGPNLAKVEKLQSNNPIIAAKLAWGYLTDIFLQTLNGILGLLSQFAKGSGPPPGQSISGPIGLIKQGSTVVSTRDWTAVLLFSAALSVNLAVINALPLPALDGGQLVFVIAEALSGRKIDQRLQEGITSVAVLFLLWVSVSAAIGDVGNILSGIL
ncbi:membrane-associated zinc metalloprotease [Nitzschia inconspicua]|uniref:Membrane-associated zinc metalloprotease n=1 Tax=Nitzschia inconspicua TaxID=303405 RepID=A0A9K3KF22_9STRA|nr:membrane-associated zinc metalloprotease [Nitzschia inconspicua]